MNETTNEHRSVLPLDGSVLLRARAEMTSHFGASAGRADARRRDEVDVGHRRGAATKPIRALAAAPLRAAARRAAGRRFPLALLLAPHIRPGYCLSLAPCQRALGPAAKCEVISARALRGFCRFFAPSRLCGERRNSERA